MKKILTILLTISAIALLAGCSYPSEQENNANTNTSNSSENETKKVEINLSENIEKSAEIASNGKLIIFAENKNSVTVRLDIEVDFYDSEGNELRSGKDVVNAVSSGRKIAIEMFDTPLEFSDYKLTIEAVEEDTYISYDKELKMTEKDTGEEVAVQITNNSEDTIDWITASVVYYKNNKAVGISEGLESDIKPGKSANYNIGYAFDNDFNYVEFDDYKVFINEAYSNIN